MTSTNRRHVLHLLAAAAGMAALPAMAATPAKIAMEVWKDPNCGCCKDWIVLMEQAGFAVKVHDVGNSAVRAKLGLPTRLGSCHTALVGGYLVEGHVPAADVHKLLKQKPKALGIAVPGMPIGSPGMDGPEYGGRKDPYDVLLVTQSLMRSDVSTSVFTSYRG
ncbi:DUF411 domain-containing protein [Comamonas thiooxydans]|uniref:DUF411 domain-containing protein n=1 Tax=Comamonas thiooxydans TaxID=363952 RepID=UPI00050ED71F|nr:DUF411 domain-containing protein [Comamonas thiooxydans]KGG87600.1 Twin-arginine translocation pathway signal [Comamonas thiooxydans]